MREVGEGTAPSVSTESGEEEDGGALSSFTGNIHNLHLVQIRQPKSVRNWHGALQQVVFIGVDMTNMVGEVAAGVEVNKVNG